MRGGKRVSIGDWGGVDGDEGEDGRRGEVEEDIRACERVGGSEQAKCRGVSQAAPEFGERGLTPKNVVRGGDEEWEVWPQKAGRNVDHHLGLGVFVALWCFCFLFCKCLEFRILRAV